jgi:glycosyltransferase involved in cell wall biosynthesis
MTSDTVGGVWTYAVDLAGALGRLGVEVHLATMGAELSEDQWRQAHQVGLAGLWESTFDLEWMADPWADVARAGEWLLALEAELTPDLVHLNGYAHGALSWQAPAVVVAHSCVLSWWQAVHGCPAPPEWGHYGEQVTEGLAAAAAVVTPTRAMADALYRCYGFTGSTGIHNGRSTGWVRRPTPKETMVLATGRVWDEAKNLALLDQVAGDLDWPVVIAGPAAPPNHGETEETGGDRPTRFLGRLSFDELSDWLLRAAIFVAPARYEPFGLGVLEAAQTGSALVVGAIPAMFELWGDAAVFVDPDDPEALVAAINRLCRRDIERRHWGNVARHRAARYGVEMMARRYLELYRRLPVGTGRRA